MSLALRPCPACAQMVFTNTCTCPHCGETKVCRARALPATALALGLSLSALGCLGKGQSDYSGSVTDDWRDSEDTVDPSDLDGDGFTVEGGDCDDHRAGVNPEAREIPGDAFDSNCDGDTEPKPDSDYDGDGVTVGDGDCDDGDASIHPGAEETAGDGVDTNCDGDDNT